MKQTVEQSFLREAADILAAVAQGKKREGAASTWLRMYYDWQKQKRQESKQLELWNGDNEQTHEAQ